MKLLQYILLVTLFGSILTCNDSQDLEPDFPIDEKCKLIRIKSLDEQGQVEDGVEFEFDNLGRISIIYDLPEKNIYDYRRRFEYFTDSVIVYVDRRVTEEWFVDKVYTKIYFEDAKIKVVEDWAGSPRSSELEYDTNDKLRKITTYSIFTPSISDSTLVLSDNNIYETTSNFAKSYYEHDNMINPFYGKLFSWAIHMSYYYFINTNNIVSYEWVSDNDESIVKVNYEYNSDGYPTRIHFTNRVGSVVDTVYEYECL